MVRILVIAAVDAQYDQSTSPDIIFADNASCALVVETTIGPYFVSGELLRTNMTEGQKGVPLHLDIQLISTSTCSPVKDMVIDMWHSNATGVTKDAKVLLSGEAAAASYEGGVATHIGQLFFDRDLVSSTCSRTESRKPAATPDYAMPVGYRMLGGDTLAEGGVLAWITVGVDVSAHYSEQAPLAAQFTGNDAMDDGGSNSSPTSTTDYLGTWHARHRYASPA
ncbi:hypothetical protein PG984_011551 [Apiospora sp. TS-2023a]